MRYLFILLSVALLQSADAQTPFEGKITYNVRVTQETGEGVITAYFSRPGIRLEFVEAKNPDKRQETIVINLDSGKLFTLQADDKTYKVSTLKQIVQPNLPAGKTIAGYTTTPTIFDGMALPSGLSSLLSQPVLYPAKDLYYPVPQVYRNIPELIMIHNNQIVLGLEFKIAERRYGLDEGDTSATLLFSAEATTVVLQKIDPALFIAPADYTKQERYDYRMSDSLSMMMDSSASVLMDSANMPADPVFTPEPKTPVKKKKPAPKKKAVSKQLGLGRKED